MSLFDEAEKENKINISNRKLETWDVEVCCIVLPVLLGRKIVSVDLKKKSCKRYEAMIRVECIT